MFSCSSRSAILQRISIHCLEVLTRILIKQLDLGPMVPMATVLEEVAVAGLRFSFLVPISIHYQELLRIAYSQCLLIELVLVMKPHSSPNSVSSLNKIQDFLRNHLHFYSKQIPQRCRSFYSPSLLQDYGNMVLHNIWSFPT